MIFRTEVDIPKPTFSIEPLEQMLFVGSCFADNIGRRFADEKFRAVVNPYGVMYNPVSILHTVRRFAMPLQADSYDRLVCVFTLGTNHVYRLRETGEIVDNCQKRPQRLFTERELTVDECASYLRRAVEALCAKRDDVRVIITVSPIRYAKYGFHGSQLSKATLLLAADKLVKEYASSDHSCKLAYFPAYEIVNDELRDYRFYREDMLHPSDQAVKYIHQRFADTFFANDTHAFLKKWQPIKAALNHRPFNPDSEDYKAFLAKAKEDERKLVEEYGS